MSVYWKWICGLIALVLTSSFGALAAEDEGQNKPDPSNVEDMPVEADVPSANHARKEEKPKVEKNPFVLPADGRREELMEFVKELMKRRPDARTSDEFAAHFKKVAVVMLEATKKILDVNDLDDRVAMEALMARFEALKIQEQLGEKDAAKAELELAREFSIDSRENLAKLARNKLLIARLKDIKGLPEEDQEKLIEDAVAYVKGDDTLGPKSIRAAMAVGKLLEDGGNDQLAANVYEKFAKLFATAGDAKSGRFATKLIGMARRQKLIGRPIEIDGNLVTGKPIDWSAYKGKVVLINFWATSSGPCIQDLSNIKINYSGFHSKGFDVVGISLDDNQAKLEKVLSENRIPWSNLFSTDKEATGWEHPLADKYGVTTIPFGILVGKDGNVIKMDVRGPALQEGLKELLGPPDEQALKAAIADVKAREEELKKAAAKVKAGTKKLPEKELPRQRIEVRTRDRQ